MYRPPPERDQPGELLWPSEPQLYPCLQPQDTVPISQVDTCPQDTAVTFESSDLSLQPPLLSPLTPAS